MRIVKDAVRELGGVWPGYDVDAVYLYRIDDRYIAGLPGGTAPYICTREEFEQCARRLRNEPSWDDAPNGAVAKAQDSGGEWYWYGDKLLRTSKATGVWQYNSTPGRYLRATQGEVIGDWKRTMELRPEEEDKVEDENDWHKRGELPPVGTVCEVFPYWHVCESIAPHQNGMVMHDRNNYEYFLATKNTRFRPLQTERERWIKAAQLAIDMPLDHAEMLVEIYDKGLAKMSEDK